MKKIATLLVMLTIVSSTAYAMPLHIGDSLSITRQAVAEGTRAEDGVPLYLVRNGEEMYATAEWEGTPVAVIATVQVPNVSDEASGTQTSVMKNGMDITKLGLGESADGRWVFLQAVRNPEEGTRDYMFGYNTVIGMDGMQTDILANDIAAEDGLHAGDVKVEMAGVALTGFISPDEFKSLNLGDLIYLMRVSEGMEPKPVSGMTIKRKEWK